MMMNDSRPEQLLRTILQNDETRWMPVDAAERDIVTHADAVRTMAAGHEIEIRKAVSSCDWSMGIEILKFMSEPHDDADRALAVVMAAPRYDNDMRTGVLASAYADSVRRGIPPEWSMAEAMSPKDAPVRRRSKLVINPKEFKI